MKTKYNPKMLTKKTKLEVSELIRLCEEGFQCDIKSKNRKQNNVNARMAFATILKKKGFSYDKVGSFISRDHATIIHYHRKLDMYLGSDEFFKTTYEKIKSEFEIYCIEKKLENPKNFVEKILDENLQTSMPHYNEELISYVKLLNKQKKDLYLTIEKLQLKNHTLNLSENRVKNLIEIVKQRTKIGTEEYIEKKLNVWYNGIYEK